MGWHEKLGGRWGGVHGRPIAVTEDRSVGTGHVLISVECDGSEEVVLLCSSALVLVRVRVLT